MRPLYSTLQLLLAFWHLPLFAKRFGRSPFDLAVWRTLLGHVTAQPPGKTIWIDVGRGADCDAISRLIAQLEVKYAGYDFVLTGVSEEDDLRSPIRIGTKIRSELRPLDLMPVVKRFLSAIQPQLVLLLGAELRPNLFRCAAQSGVPLIYLCIHEEPKPLPLLLKVLGVGRSAVKDIATVIAQTEVEAAQWLAWGLTQKRLKVAGRISNDVKVAKVAYSEKHQDAALWPRQRLTWCAADLRAEEYTLVLDALRRLTPSMPSLLLLLVPHPAESVEKAAAMCRQRGFLVARHNRAERVKPSTQVLLLENEGQLRELFVQAQVAFIGGSMSHQDDDILTPAACGVPLIVGPNVTAHADLKALLLEAKAISSVQNANELAERVKLLLEHPEIARKMSEATMRVVENNRGAMRRVCHILRERLEWTQSTTD